MVLVGGRGRGVGGDEMDCLTEIISHTENVQYIHSGQGCEMPNLH